jgi:L-alanine-DL-glutamate epimerase-like enolase superfamily enzyme
MLRHLDAGYTMVKMKVGGLPLADDVRRVAAVKETLGQSRRAGGRCQCKIPA